MPLGSVNTPRTSRGKARGRLDNPAGLGPGNQFREVGIFTDRGFRMQPPFGGTFDATLLLFQLLLFANLFSAALFQRRPSDWPILSDPFLPVSIGTGRRVRAGAACNERPLPALFTMKTKRAGPSTSHAASTSGWRRGHRHHGCPARRHRRQILGAWPR